MFQQTALDFTAVCTAPSKRSVKAPVFNETLRADFTTSAKTAIFRNGASAPVKMLLSLNLLPTGSAINYGKGKYDHDSDAIASATGHCVGYDYTFQPDTEVLGNSYDTLYSGYVVNTLPPQARQYVWQQMANCCLRGVAFIAARTDKNNISGEPFEDGVKTSIGTFQKSYSKGELAKEGSSYFEYVTELKCKSGFSIVACSHEPLHNSVLEHARA